MGNTNTKTKDKIITAAWKLFHLKGYEKTTVDDIINQSGTSKGTFYYYFSTKDDLLSTLSDVFDLEYLNIEKRLDQNMNCFDKLIALNSQIYHYINDNIDYELLGSLYSTQLVTKGERHLLDKNRVYYRIITEIVKEGQEKKEISDVISADEIITIYTMLERAVIYDWCLNKASYSFGDYCDKYIPQLLAFLKI